MVFADWTFSGVGTGALDTSVKYAGNSSYKSTVAPHGSNILTHDTFLEPQAQVIFWAMVSGANLANVKARVNHSAFGNLDCTSSAGSIWDKFKVVFWYDSGSNTKYGRIYRWIDSAWVQQGTDTDFGTGSPSAGTIGVGQWSNRDDTYVWIDEVEVSA